MTNITMQTMAQIGPSKNPRLYNPFLSLPIFPLPDPPSATQLSLSLSLSLACADRAQGHGTCDGAADPTAKQGLEPGWTWGTAP
jgi:hypothetical protein